MGSCVNGNRNHNPRKNARFKKFNSHIHIQNNTPFIPVFTEKREAIPPFSHLNISVHLKAPMLFRMIVNKSVVVLIFQTSCFFQDWLETGQDSEIRELLSDS